MSNSRKSTSVEEEKHSVLASDDKITKDGTTNETINDTNHIIDTWDIVDNCAMSQKFFRIFEPPIDNYLELISFGLPLPDHIENIMIVHPTLRTSPYGGIKNAAVDLKNCSSEEFSFFVFRFKEMG